MKYISSRVGMVPLSIALVGIVILAFLFSAFFVRADTAVAVSTVAYNNSGVAVTSAPIGTPIHAVVQVASSSSGIKPNGTVNINRYPNLTCSGTPLTQANVPLDLGFATSSETDVPAGGFSYLVQYNGDATNTPQTGTCTSIAATAANVSITTSLSASSIFAGSSVYDTATLNNKTNIASGTVTYTVYTNNSCTTGAQSAGTKNVSNGVVPNSDTLTFNTPGTYYWSAVYSGDGNNSGASSACGSEILTVNATSTGTTTPPRDPHDKPKHDKDKNDNNHDKNYDKNYEKGTKDNSPDHDNGYGNNGKTSSYDFGRAAIRASIFQRLLDRLHW